MSALYVIGVDPGGTTGIAALRFIDGRHDPALASIVQSSPAPVVRIVDALAEIGRVTGVRTILAVEKFVVGHRAARSSSADAGRLTRELIGSLLDFAEHTRHVEFVQRAAAEVKPWATDKRLEAVGLDIPTKLRDARDGARHALFAAVQDGGVPDPLSAKARTS